jgi:hypothetical protein
MKKCLIALAFLFCSIPLFSQVNPETKTPIYFGRSLNTFNVYTVGGSTTTSATYFIGTSSINFTTTGGLYPGTTSFALSAYTLNQLVSKLNSLPATTVGAEGGIVAVLSSTTWGDDSSIRLIQGTSNYIKGSVNVKTITQSDTNHLSYTFPRPSGINKWHLADVSANVTYTGTTYINIYDGVTSTNTLIRHEKFVQSGVDNQMDLSGTGYFSTTGITGMLFEVVSSSNISAGYVNIQSFQDGD